MFNFPQFDIYNFPKSIFECFCILKSILLQCKWRTTSKKHIYTFVIWLDVIPKDKAV